MTILEYAKSEAPLEERANHLFQEIDKLDKESFDLYNEISELDKLSPEIIEKYSTRINKMLARYTDIDSAFDYLRGRESHKYDVIAVQLLCKSVLVSYAVAFSYAADRLLGILAFILLTRNMFSTYMNDRKILDRRKDKYNFHQMYMTKTTIENGGRLLKGKIDKTFKENHDIRFYAKCYISLLLNGIIDIGDPDRFEEIDNLPEPIKNTILELLQERLNIDIDNKDLISIIEKIRTQTNQPRLIQNK